MTQPNIEASMCSEHPEYSGNLNDDSLDDHHGASSYEETTRTTHVHFLEQEVEYKATISRSEITADEAIASWYTHQERAKLMVKYIKTVERRQSGKKPKKNSSYRGLETFDQCDALELQYTIEACVDAVLLEQHRQWTENIVDWEALARVSIECSEQSKALALAMAKSDKREAKKANRRMALMVEESMRSISSTSIESFQDMKKLVPHKASQQTALVMGSTISPVIELRSAY
ncbi:unnamed protein product [Cylindrotheca closterium]|uniref:Uncharacterized protein n=1 Tax=Cylindrotheca closterium TaxID=2856 RepID=A0AAD2CU86_9STRA|nr:unnamed protein product [Cylindrotheca closterium]CAJ1943423.1 unnamed protein product [Cylindrotheca closterium]